MQDVTATARVNNETDNRSGARTNKTPEVTAALDWVTVTGRAVQRVQEFVETSLREAPSEEAAMAASSGLFYRALFQLNQAVDEALQDVEDPIARVDALARAIELMLRIARQIDRFGQLRTLLLEARHTLPETKQS